MTTQDTSTADALPQAGQAVETPDATPQRRPGRTARGVTISTAMSLVVRVVGIGIGMVTTSLLARTLAPAGYGALSLALTLVTAAAQTADLGIAVTAAARIAREDQASAGRTLSTGLAIRTTAALIAAAGLIGAALAGAFGGSSSVVAVTAIATPLSAAAVLTAGSTARFRPEVASVLALVQGALWFGAVLLIHTTKGSLLFLAWSFVAVTTLQTAIGLVLNRKVVPLGRPSLREVRGIFSVSWPLAVSSFAFTAYYRLDSLILFKARGATELGFYAAGYKFVDVAQIVPTILVAPLLPLAATSLAMDEGRRRTILSLATRMAAVVGVGVAGMLISLAPQLISIIYGAEFKPAVRPLVLLAIAYVGIPVGYVGSTILSALGKAKPIALVTVTVAGGSLIAQAWASVRWGATGAAAVTAVTQLAIGATYCVLATRAMRTRLPVAALLSSIFVMCVVVLPASVVNLPWIVEAVAVAVLMGGGLLLFRVITLADLRRVLARRAVS
jgi:O-antigen/teichoic acid export membrane protein